MPALVFTRSSRLIPGFRAMPGRHHEHLGARRLVVAVGADDPRVEALDRARLVLVQCLALRHALDHVDEHHRAGQVLLGQPLRRRRAHVAGTDHRDLLEHCCTPSMYVKWAVLAGGKIALTTWPRLVRSRHLGDRGQHPLEIVERERLRPRRHVRQLSPSISGPCTSTRVRNTLPSLIVSVTGTYIWKVFATPSCVTLTRRLEHAVAGIGRSVHATLYVGICVPRTHWSKNHPIG